MKVGQQVLANTGAPAAPDEQLGLFTMQCRSRKPTQVASRAQETQYCQLRSRTILVLLSASYTRMN